MSRETKFRALVKTSPSKPPKMIQVKGIDWGSNFVTDNSTHARYSIIGNVLMQYTGLDDQNENEIYEDDIIRCKFNFAAKRWWKDLEDMVQIDKEYAEKKKQIEILHGVVQYDAGAYKISFAYGSLPLRAVRFPPFCERTRNNGYDSESTWWDFEVVGNVHENPELLKGDASA